MENTKYIEKANNIIQMARVSGSNRADLKSFFK